MTQQTRNTIANFLLGMSMLLIVAFVAQHFMTSRPSWHDDLVWTAVAVMALSRIVRGRQRARATHDVI